MAGGLESNGTGIGEFSSLVLGTATRYRIFFSICRHLEIRISKIARNADLCALSVPFLFCPVWRLLAVGGSGAMRLFNFLQEQFLLC